MSIRIVTSREKSPLPTDTQPAGDSSTVEAHDTLRVWKPLAIGVVTSALRFVKGTMEKWLQLLPSDDPASDKAWEPGIGRPCLRDVVVDLQLNPRGTFTAILLKHMKGQGPLGMAEYLFLAYQLQRYTFLHNKITRDRLIELLNLHQGLFRLFHSRFPYEDYLLQNINAFAYFSGINNDVSFGVERILASVKDEPQYYCRNPDLIIRNLVSLLRESEQLNGVAFGNLMSKFDATLVTLAARAVYGEEPGPREEFESYLQTPMGSAEKGDWYRLQVISTASGFWAVLELDRLIVPLTYPNFAAFTTALGLDWVESRCEEQEGFFSLPLPAGIRLCLSLAEAKELRNACKRIRAGAGYEGHDRIWSLLYGMAE